MNSWCESSSSLSAFTRSEMLSALVILVMVPVVNKDDRAWLRGFTDSPLRFHEDYKSFVISFYSALSTFCSSPGTCTSTTSSLWNQNHSPICQSWSDCKCTLSDLLPQNYEAHCVVTRFVPLKSESTHMLHLT